MWNAKLDTLQAGIKSAWRNINNFRYVEDTTLMTETKKKSKSLLMRMKKESEKPGKTQYYKNKTKQNKNLR